ncbi:MAG: TatD family hydrolase [Cyclobacteriaceae bacterium]
MLIDTHAHIFLEEFKDDVDEVIQRAIDAGVEKILLPNIDVDSIDDMLDIEAKYPKVCHAMMGLHPCSVKQDFEKQLQVVEDWLSKRTFIAIGEIGTDLYWDKTFWEEQKVAFHFQCELAIKYDVPVAIHCRDTIDETIDLVAEFDSKKLSGVFHCFTGSTEQGKSITDLGFYLGLGGVSTFKNGGLDRVIPELDSNKLVLETDSPYLSPAPERGKRNEPCKVSLIAARVSEFLNLSIDDVASLTTRNANELFFRP